MITRVNDVSISKIAGATLSTVRTATICSAVAACCGEPAGPESMVILGNASSWADAPGATRKHHHQEHARREGSTHAALRRGRSGDRAGSGGRASAPGADGTTLRRDPIGSIQPGARPAARTARPSAPRGRGRSRSPWARRRPRAAPPPRPAPARAPRRPPRRARAARAGKSGSPSPRSGTARGPRARHTPIPWRRRAAGRGSRGGRRRGSRRAVHRASQLRGPPRAKMAGGRPRPPVSPRSIASVTVRSAPTTASAPTTRQTIPPMLGGAGAIASTRGPSGAVTPAVAGGRGHRLGPGHPRHRQGQRAGERQAPEEGHRARPALIGSP